MKKVITYGTFDLFHEGHYKLLERAKKLGDYLIVGVTTEHYDEARGKVNVVDSIVERIENVKKTGFADEIIVEDHEGQKIEDIKKYHVDTFVLGSDWTGHFDYLKKYCDVVYLERTPNISSTMIRKQKFPIIRLGIVGSGRLAPRFVSECRYVSGVNVQAVYNPNIESANIFGEKHELEVYSDSFDDFLKHVDAIYVASPNETHHGYIRVALENNKHVLSEKPLSFSKDSTEALHALAARNNKVLIEGIKVAYCPGFQELISVAKSGIIGEIRDVEACFSRLILETSRERIDSRYGGAFLEYAGYPLLPILKLLGPDYKDIQIHSIKDANGVDLYTKIQFIYENGLATAKMGVGVKSEGQLIIAGTKGYILAESPWWLTKKFEIRYEDPDKIDVYTPSFQGDGLRYEISEFVSRINNTGKKDYKLTVDESVWMAGIVEKFMKEREKSFSGKN